MAADVPSHRGPPDSEGSWTRAFEHIGTPTAGGASNCLPSWQMPLHQACNELGRNQTVSSFPLPHLYIRNGPEYVHSALSCENFKKVKENKYKRNLKQCLI